MPRRKYAWETLSDQQLLKRRLSSLRVTVEGTWLEDCVSAPAKYCHGRRPIKANNVYGTPSEGNFASRPKISVKINAVASGWMMTHAAPSRVCL